MSMSAENDSSKFHIAMFPWFAIGHITPFLHLSNELAQRGHKISFMLPNKALIQLQHINLHPNLITLYPITVPPVEGLPPGTETASDIDSISTFLLVAAFDLTRDQVDLSLQNLKPDFVFCEAHWISELGERIGFKTVCYNVICAAALAISSVPAGKVPKDRPFELAELPEGYPSSTSVPAGKVLKDRPLELAELPEGYPSSTVVLRRDETESLSIIKQEFGSGGMKFYERIISSLTKCNAISIRTCHEIEGPVCDYIASQFNKPMLLTGPVLPKPDESPLEAQWAEWLSIFIPGSVIFCALGSQLVLEKDQFQELVLGLELAQHPFFLAVKPPAGFASVEEALPEGFEERVKGKGVVHGGWVQQPQILSHPSIGCFVSHCGFGSMWESLMNDCQIVLLPHLGDQILNARILAGELKVGVEVEKDENGRFSKEGVCKAIKCAMDKDGEVGVLIKNNHAIWKEKLVSSTFMSDYIDRFVQQLYELK